jgi:hypothetical protein
MRSAREEPTCKPVALSVKNGGIQSSRASTGTLQDKMIHMERAIKHADTKNKRKKMTNEAPTRRDAQT